MSAGQDTSVIDPGLSLHPPPSNWISGDGKWDKLMRRWRGGVQGRWRHDREVEREWSGGGNVREG